jgi:hypothetical protein
VTGEEEDKSVPSPLLDAVESAESLYGMFLSYKAAGFTEHQAMQLLCAMLQGVVSNQ